jgi:hypothetical protein
MNIEALILFLILLLGLVLCCFLGDKQMNIGFNEGFTGVFTGTFQTNDQANTSGASTGSSQVYDNYNHFNGASTQLANGSTYYGPNGGSVVVVTNSDGSQSLQVTLSNGQTPMTFASTQPTTSPTATDASSNVESYTNYYGVNGTATEFYGPNGATATVVNTNNGQKAIQIKTSSGTYTYTQSGAYYNPDNTTSTQYYGSTGYPIQSSSYSLAYQGPYGGSAGAVTGPAGNTAYYAQGPNGNTVAGTTSNNYDYSSALPPGIPASQIPPGQEDLYILKSEIVPPVCPVCPVSAACPRQEKCPPCPAPQRCKEPSFECKKVPNYNAINEDYLPQPVLNDFSTFGM